MHAAMPGRCEPDVPQLTDPQFVCVRVGERPRAGARVVGMSQGPELVGQDGATGRHSLCVRLCQRACLLEHVSRRSGAPLSPAR